MTECRACGAAFTGTSAFDAHRTGNHSFDYDPDGPTAAEALAPYDGRIGTWEDAYVDATPKQRRAMKLPATVDGRRCRTPEEMESRGLVQNERGEWGAEITDEKRASLAALRASR